MDDETAAAILRLQLDDINAFLQYGNANRDSDAEFAFELYQQDLANRQLLLGDRKIARNIHRAVNAYGPILSILANEETVYFQDRQLAPGLNGQVHAAHNIPKPAHQRPNEPLSDDLVTYNRLRQPRPEDVFPITRGETDDTAPTKIEDSHTAVSTISPARSSSKVNEEESSTTFDGRSLQIVHLKPQQYENPEDPRPELAPKTTPFSGGKATLKPPSTDNPATASASNAANLESCTGCEDVSPAKL